VTEQLGHGVDVAGISIESIVIAKYYVQGDIVLLKKRHKPVSDLRQGIEIHELSAIKKITKM
jgi:hypothetical protein